jgi:hypothetical protein
MNWTDFLPQARAVVEATKLQYPNSEGVVCVGGGKSDSQFRRQGVGYHVRSYGVPENINSLITQNAEQAQVDPGLAGQQNALFSKLMTDNVTSQPGYNQLTNTANQNPLDYSGRDSLLDVSRIDPYSGDYEAATNDAYVQRASDALSRVASGPDAVRGGDARTGIMQGVMTDRLAQGRGQEVRDAQQQDVSNVMNASQGMANIENTRTGTSTAAAMGLNELSNGVGGRALGAAQQLDVQKLANLQLLQLAAQLQGKTGDQQIDDFSGAGDQGGWQAGLSCCFIFLEVLNGKLPWYVEMARNDFWTLERRTGYKWMASWLCPLMSKFGLIKHIVNQVMVKPFLGYGKWLYSDEGKGRKMWPVCWSWLMVWESIGKVKLWLKTTVDMVYTFRLTRLFR